MFSEEFNNNKKNNDCDEENLDCENTADSDMTEGHFESIFVNCDVENTGYVCVSTLLKFMEPFLQENLDELEKIKSLLDPIGIDPKIDKKKFCSEMCKWTEHKKLEESTSPQSTPRLSTSSRTSPLSKFLQCSFEQNLNTTYSCGSTPSPLTHHYFERSLEIQEEIDNLKQQNRKLNDDLQDLQSQLLLSEECNINLQADFSRITKRLEVEQQLNQNLQKFQLECEELRESEISLKRDMERLINNNNTLKCENNQLKQNFEELQDEKIQLCEEIELYRTKNNENNRLLFEARYKIDELREQLSLKEDSLKAVEDNFNTFEEKIKDYENTIAFLRAEKEKCKNTSKSEKSFKENIDHTQNIRYIDSNMNIDQNNATINTSYPYPIQDEIVRDMPSTKTLYSMVFDPKVLQNNSLLNELKEVTSNDHVVKYQEEIAKFKSYLEETSTYLKNLTRKICSQSTSIENIFVGWEEDKSTVPLKKERYYENHYYNFNRNLSRCIFLLMNRDKITKEISHKSTQMSPDSLRDGKSYERTLSSLPPTHTITLQPSKLSHHHSNFNQHHSAPPTPKLRSKFGYRSQSPEISGGFAGYNEKQTMAEPCSFETPKLDVQLNKAIIEMNNNVSPDSPAALVYPTVPTVSINRNNQNKNENNVIPSSSHMESKVESTTSNEVSGNNVYVPDTPEIHVPEIRHENWSNIMRRFSNMSISASSTNSGSTESLSIDNEHTLNGEDRHQLKIALDMAIANRNSEHTQSLQATPATDNEKITTDALRRRSKSERSHEEPEQIESFPSIPDTLLEDLNLLTKPEEESKEDLCEQDEIERKFMALSLAFMTDGTTLTTRRERLQKFRDQAEKNLLSEVEQLMAAIHKLNPLCIDAERTELVTSLITQVDVLKKAAKQSWNMSQCFGAVQQEWRLNESVKLMLKYVESVKLQRDTARRHFQYTRRMLQETTSAETPKTSTQPKTVLSNSSNSSSNSNNSRLMTRRRASIATISRPATPTETLRTLANRRPSPSHTDPIVRRLELPERLSPAIIRSTRQSRAELGVGVEQLQNIRENMEAESSDVSDYECSEVSSKTTNRLNNTENSQINDTCAPNPYALMVCNFFRRYCGDSLHSSGLLHEICVTGALVFFFIAAMQLGSVLLEVEYARRGVSVNHIPWSWANWDEVLQVLFNWNSSNDNGPRPY